MAIKVRRKHYPEEDFQMAPMIDMVFLLLVFFMCVSTMAQAEKQAVDLAQSEAGEVPDDLDNRGIISLDEEGLIYMGARQVELATMRAVIKAELEKNPRLKIQVRADGATAFSHIKKVLKACAEVGAYDIIHSTEQAP